MVNGHWTTSSLYNNEMFNFLFAIEELRKIFQSRVFCFVTYSSPLPLPPFISTTVESREGTFVTATERGGVTENDSSSESKVPFECQTPT